LGAALATLGGSNWRRWWSRINGINLASPRVGNAGFKAEGEALGKDAFALWTYQSAFRRILSSTIVMVELFLVLLYWFKICGAISNCSVSLCTCRILLREGEQELANERLE
jgi:hypothetical protein